jgi:uncharacterized membrane protein
MTLKRVTRHLLSTHWQVRRAFPPRAREAIAAAIRASEAAHVGRIYFAVEEALHVRPLLRGQSARQRALEVFSNLQAWDTEHNSGLLIYLLLADRAIEIVADRGIYSKLEPREWQDICRQMQVAFRQGQFEAGVVSGIQSITATLIRHFPAALPAAVP